MSVLPATVKSLCSSAGRSLLCAATLLLAGASFAPVAMAGDTAELQLLGFFQERRFLRL